MLTPDVMIDRRILLEAKALLEDGFDVYVLAGQSPGPQFTRPAGVPVEHVHHLPPRGSRIEATRIAIIARLAPLPFPPGPGHNPLTEPLRRRAAAGSPAFGILRSVERVVARFVARARASVVWRGTLAAIFMTNVTARALQRLRNRDQPNPLLYLYEQSYIQRATAYRPDIVHVHDLPLLRAGRLLQEELQTKLVYDMHEFWPEQLALSPEARAELRELEGNNIRAADLRITVNPRLAEAISEAYGGVEIRVVENAVSAPPDLHSTPRDLFRTEHGAPAGRPILLFQGWMAPGRNLESLVAGVLAAATPYTLVLMGYGDYRAELAEAAAGSDRVLFVDVKPQETLLYYTASADIGVIPYSPSSDINTRLASPNKLYEFIVSRLPILSNQLEFIDSIVTPNGFGKVTVLDSPADVAAALDAFPLDRLDEFRANLRERGTRFSWDVEKHRLLAAYEAMLEPNGDESRDH
jgi:glycosyltransferase involved in cell wall biosynthesis